ncbi:unnamed protein product, partial [Mesorhabditis spiculigera]
MVRLLLVLLLLADVGTADDSVTCALNTPRFYDPSTGCYPGPVGNSHDPDTILFWEVVEGYRVYYVCPEPGHKVCRSKGKDKKSPDQFSCHGTADRIPPEKKEKKCQCSKRGEPPSETVSEEWFKRWEAGFNGECGSEETRKEDAMVERLFRPVVCEAGYFCSEGSGDSWPAALSGPLGERVGCWDKVNKPTPYSSGICVAESAPPHIVYTASADLKRLIESRQGRLGYGVLFPRGPNDFTDFKPFHYDVACDVAHRPWHPVEGCVVVERHLPSTTVTETAETIGADWGIAFYETVLNNDGVTWTHVVYACALPSTAPYYVSFCSNGKESDIVTGCWSRAWRPAPNDHTACDDPTTTKAKISAEWPHKLAGTPLDFAPIYTRGKEIKYEPEWLITTTTKSTTTVSTQSTNATMAVNTTKATTTTTTRSTTTERPWSDEELMHINSGILCMVALLFLTIYFKCKKYEAPPRVTWLEVTTPEAAHTQNPPKQTADMAKSARSSATV